MTYVIGDIHGHYDRLIDLLTNDAGVIRNDLTWQAGDSTVVFIGDYVDRGPDGIGVIDFLISLQIQADLAGGRVICLLGNHEPQFVAAHRFGKQKNGSPQGSFYDNWRNKQSGGQQHDLDALTPEHIAWMSHLPAMVKLGDTLFMHADAMLYTRYGDSINAVNQYFERMMYSYDPEWWDRTLADFSEHKVFIDRDNGITNMENVLSTYGAERIVHGHTPIGFMTNKRHNKVWEPLIYNDGKCINVDGGMAYGGSGFVYMMDVGLPHP